MLACVLGIMKHKCLFPQRPARKASGWGPARWMCGDGGMLGVCPTCRRQLSSLILAQGSTQCVCLACCSGLPWPALMGTLHPRCVPNSEGHSQPVPSFLQPEWCVNNVTWTYLWLGQSKSARLFSSSSLQAGLSDPFCKQVEKKKCPYDIWIHVDLFQSRIIC